MRILKKLTAWILTLAIVMALPVESVAEQIENTESVPQTYLNKLEILSALQLYSFTDKQYNEMVTRAQFSRMVMDLMGFDENGLTDTIYFSDVTEQTEYASAVNSLFAYGLVSGMGDGNFYPFEGITYLQALKVLISALGYNPIAEANGGYSSGYIKCALKIGLIENPPNEWNVPITFDLAAQLILQALETEVLEVLEFEGDKIRYTTSSDSLLMNVYHDIYLAEGRMTDNGVTAVNGESQIDVNSVQIGRHILHGANETARELLGHTVNYYYKENAGDYTLLYAYAAPNKNKKITILADEILTEDKAFSKTCIVATIDGKKRKFRIDRYADLLYNGSIDESFTKDTLKINQGCLTLLDADGNGEYELVFAEEYADIIVSAHSPESKNITAQYASDDYIKINYDEYKCVVFENADGTEAEASDITSGSVLSVFKSKNKEKIRFVCSKKSEELLVDAVSDEGTGIIVYYGEGEAKLSKGYMNLMKEKPFICPTPSLGSYYKAYFNHEGLIAFLTEIEGRSQYAYLLRIAKESKMGHVKVGFKIHTEDDITMIVTAKEKIMIDKVNGQNPESLFADRRIVDANGDVIPQLIKVTVNSKAELSAIEIDNTVDSGPFGFDLERFSLDWSSGNDQWEPYTGYNSKSLAGNHIISTNTKIFCVYSEDSLMRTTDETKVVAVDYKDYIAYFSNRSWSKGYDSDETWELGAVVLGIPPTDEYQYRTFTVERAVYRRDPYVEIKTEITGWFAGRIMTYCEEEEGVFNEAVKKRYPDSNGSLKAGDVLQVNFTADSDIRKAKLIYSPLRDKNPDYCFIEGGLGNKDAYMLGYLCAAKQGRISVFCKANEEYVNTGGVVTATPESFWVNLWRSEGNILHFDRETETLRKITYHDVPITAASISGNGFSDFDTSVKVLAIRTSGQVYDVLIVS